MPNVYVTKNITTTFVINSKVEKEYTDCKYFFKQHHIVFIYADFKHLHQ